MFKVKKRNKDKPLLKTLKNAITELNEVKAGKLAARDFDDLLNEGFNAKKYNGVLSLNEDPLEIQLKLRDEWENTPRK